MAELAGRSAATSSCCSVEAQATCCEVAEKEACCGSGAAGGACRCSVGQKSEAEEASEAEIRETVGCVAGALTEDEFRAALTDAGLVDLEIRATHRVHEHAGAAIIRARKPVPSS
jgi:hypothetical protein